MLPQGVSKIAFWDVDSMQIDAEAQSLYVMQQVFNYGTWADYQALFQYYGKDRVRREIVKASQLDKKSLALLTLLLNLQLHDFECYKRVPSHHSFGSF